MQEVILNQCEVAILILDGINNLHIKEVNVFTGDDDYQETDRLSIQIDEANKNKLIVAQRLYREPAKSKYRIRHEPGVEIIFDTEGSGSYLLTLTHHKGCVRVDVKKYDCST